MKKILKLRVSSISLAVSAFLLVGDAGAAYIRWGDFSASCTNEDLMINRAAEVVKRNNPNGHYEDAKTLRTYFKDGEHSRDELLKYLEGAEWNVKYGIEKGSDNSSSLMFHNHATHLLSVCLYKAALGSLTSLEAGYRNKEGVDSRNFGGAGPQAEVQEANQSIALAQQNQARGEEQARKDRRRRNYPELEASSCLTPVIRSGFSGFKNTCPFAVRYTYCVESPERGTGAAFVDCSKQSGAGSVPANSEDFAHMKGGDGVHHVACKLPGTAITRKFENGRLWADCAKLGGD